MIAPLDTKISNTTLPQIPNTPDDTIQKTKKVSIAVGEERPAAFFTAKPKRASTLECCAIAIIGIALVVAFFSLSIIGSFYRKQLNISKKAGDAMQVVGISMCLASLLASLIVYQWRVGFKPCFVEKKLVP